MSSKKLTNVLAIAMAVIILGYLAINVVKGLGNSYKTSTAYIQTVSETVDAKLFIIREESIIDTADSGVIVPLAVNGEKVGSGNEIAAVFADDTSAENYSKTITLEKKLETYRKINSQVRLANLDLKKLTREINGEFNTILGAVYDNDFSDLSENELSFSEMLSRKDISLGYEVDCSDVISSLESEIDALKVKAPSQVITADSAGYFVSRLDGYENKITAANIDELTPEELKDALDSTKKSEDKNAMGKLITGYEWYAAAIVDTAQLAGIEVGRKVQLVLGDKEGDTVNAKVYSKNKVDGEDSTMIVFRCSEMNERLSMMRKVTGKIVLRSYSGIKLRKNAVHFNEEGKEGVYIIEGNVIKFNLIEEVYSDEEYVIADVEKSGLPGWLSQYDEVIVAGKDLENGKVIG